MSERFYKSYRDESRKEYGARTDSERHLTEGQLKTGAMLRIADATEMMAQRHVDLIDENKRLRADVDWYRQRLKSLDRQKSALRGVITKLKKKPKAR